MSYITVKNNQPVLLASIPVLSYDEFRNTILRQISVKGRFHCVNYFGIFQGSQIKLICCIADDLDHSILLFSSLVTREEIYLSFSKDDFAFEKFEREIHENFGIKYLDHPWFKPVRYSFNRVNKSETIANYPFFSISGEELHEVGVGPIHAGIIEPGHFRFVCNGEQILHLEIQLGFQHRGIEHLMLEKKKLLQRNILAESIAGDTVVGHTTAFSNLWENLCGCPTDPHTQFCRTLALEIERIAIHTGDLSALCTDIAYQLGSSVFGRLRTPVINFFQIWCGNRLAKGLIRAGKNNYPFTQSLANQLLNMLSEFEPDFDEMCHQLFRLPSALSRLEKTGVVTREQAESIGTVGMSARMSGICRDIRCSHPHDMYAFLQHQPVIKHHGDVYSRAQIRQDEIKQSIGYIRTLLQSIPAFSDVKNETLALHPDSFIVSLVEGWRGEICHCAITNKTGELSTYKIKDPSFHNWLALALAVRNNEISDFPVCNKSFNLSYCGHDL